MVLHCYDSVTAAAIPPAAVVLGYIDGDYPTWGELVRRFRNATTRVISVTTGTGDADMLDCERGDATPAEATQWALGQLKQGKHPTIYGSKSTLTAVIETVRRGRVRAELIDYFVADWLSMGRPLGEVRFPKRIGQLYVGSPNYVGWQFAGECPTTSGHAIDVSIVEREWAERHGWTGNPRGEHRPIIRIVP